VKEINNYIIEDFINKVSSARKTNQKQVILDIKDAQNLSDNIALVLARALGNLEKLQKNTDNDNVTVVSMDGGGF
jgi:hypothetical protein